MKKQGIININGVYQDIDLIECENPRSNSLSGYGSKIPTGYKVNFNNKLYRIYATCYSNSASLWFISKGQKYFVM